MVGIREPIMPTDHRMVLGILIGEGVREHLRYKKERNTWPITEATGGMRQDENAYFMDLKRRVKKPSRKGITTSELWILDTTWRLADQRAELGRKCTANHGECRMLTWRFQSALK